MKDFLNSEGFRIYPFHAGEEPQLFHVSCDIHADQGFCGVLAAAVHNLAEHIEKEHSHV